MEIKRSAEQPIKFVNEPSGSDIEPLASPAYPSTSAINSSFSFRCYFSFPIWWLETFPIKKHSKKFQLWTCLFFLVESIASAAMVSDSSNSDNDLYNTCETVTAKPLENTKFVEKWICCWYPGQLRWIKTRILSALTCSSFNEKWTPSKCFYCHK